MTLIQEEITLENLVSFLATIPGFKDLSAEEMIEFVAPIISITTYEPGQTMIKRGTEGSTVLFLFKGRARVNVQLDPDDNINFFINEGEILGEMALVTKEKRSADVFAVTAVICLTIDIETFQTLMASNWKVTKAVAGLIGERRIKRLASR
ncbi:MAG: cyclic nucleotide-binding domain-containing protein [Magnetococcales bacterium]|nr:cyclic nucleotide-binding domain-containing protein [Magnetococcales bacterium]